MKLVQSLWSKPSEKFGGYLNYAGRWPLARHLWYSWIISTGWALKHYGNVELVTDRHGADWLVDKLKFPFTSVRTDLDSLNVPPTLWAAGKIVAYSVQDEPFFHIDGDVYLKAKLPQRYETADLICQFLEQKPNYPGFEQIYNYTRAVADRAIPSRPSFWNYMSENSACNCGIFGGANIPAIKKYTADVLHLLLCADNVQAWRNLHIRNSMNCLIEQQTLWCSARQQDVPITPLFQLQDFLTAETLKQKALELNYNHAAVDGKNEAFGEHLGQLVKAEYPEQFRLINELFPQTRMNLALPTQLHHESETYPAPLSQVEVLYLRPR